MKYIKFLSVLFLIVSLLLLVAGCRHDPYRYQLGGSAEDVTGIEILSYSFKGDVKEHIVDIPDGMIASFYADVKALDCYKSLAFSSGGYGEVIIRIRYANGAYDELGIGLIAWYSAEGKGYAQKCYFDSKQYCQLLLKYVDESLLPDLSVYLKD